MELDPTVTCPNPVCQCTLVKGTSTCPNCETPLPGVSVPGSVLRFTAADADEGC
jgi:hypothetical protein